MVLYKKYLHIHEERALSSGSNKERSRSRVLLVFRGGVFAPGTTWYFDSKPD
jgi:hypothetical protein